MNELVNVPKGCSVNIYGRHNRVVFDKTVKSFCGCIDIGSDDCHVNDCIVSVGSNCTAAGLGIQLLENGQTVEIGADCMFSSGINILASDTHALIDAEGRVINRGKSVKIGNHVWVGRGVTILKNSVVGDGCVIGAGSVYTCHKGVSECIYAGVPARIVKELPNGTRWSRQRPSEFDD